MLKIKFHYTIFHCHSLCLSHTCTNSCPGTSNLVELSKPTFLLQDLHVFKIFTIALLPVTRPVSTLVHVGLLCVDCDTTANWSVEDPSLKYVSDVTEIK